MIALIYFISLACFAVALGAFTIGLLYGAAQLLCRWRR